MAFLEEDEQVQMIKDSNFHICESYSENQIQNFFCKICGIKLHPLHPHITYHRSQKYQNTRYSEETQISLNLMHQRQNSNRIFIPQYRHADVRQSIVNYISNLSAKLTYNRETFHLAIAIMDLTFGEYTFQQNEIILICIIIVIIAAKVNEPNYKIPLVDNIIEKLNGMFTVEDYIQNESIIFQKILHYNADIETTYKFTEEFLYRGILSDKEIGFNIIDQDISLRLVEFFQDIVRTITDLSLNCYEMYKYKASTVAASIIMLARKLFGTEYLWNQHLVDLTYEDEDMVRICANELNDLLFNQMNQKLQQIQRCQQQFTITIREYLLKKQSLEKVQKKELYNCSIAQLLQKVQEIKEHEKTCSSINILLEGSNLLHPNEDNEEDNSQRGILFKKP